jgi:hypothetical protein
LYLENRERERERRELRRSQIYQIFLNIVLLQHLVHHSAISRFFNYYF